MGFIDKTYLATQFTNFATRISLVFAKKTELPTKASDIGAMDASVTHLSGDVPTSRKVNNKALTSDITLSASDVGAIASTEKGVRNGVATLDSSGLIPSSQLPSFVDDVLEYDSLSDFPTTGETGKIYVAKDTNKTYRWGGTSYVVISETLALGETSSTAYRGDRGKIAYDHSQKTSGNPHGVTKSDVGLGNVGNFKAVSTVASQGLTDTEKANAKANIGAITEIKMNGDSKGTSGVVDLGTVITAHQDISGKLNKSNVTSKGSATQPIYFDASGVAQPTTYTLGKSVPSDAKFTDTTYSDATTSASGLMSSADKTKLDTMNASGVVWATCETASATQVKAITLQDSNYTLKNGDFLAIKFTNTNSFSVTSSNLITFTIGGKTFNVYASGAKTVTTGTANHLYGYAGNYIQYYVDITNLCLIRVSKSWDDNSTYNPMSLGFGYGTCSTATSTTAKVVTLANYNLVNGGTVCVKFDNDVNASATMNINGKGAKSIYYKGSAITSGIIKASNICTFIYNNSVYELLSINADVATVRDIESENIDFSQYFA